MNALVCWNCGNGLSSEPLPISRHASCDNCGEFLHCCRLCTQYDTNRPGACDNDLTEPPNEKTIANFCEYFSPNSTAYSGIKTTGDDVTAKLAGLFGEDIEAPESASSNPLDDLFKD